MHIQPTHIPIADLRFAMPSQLNQPAQTEQVVMATVLSRADGGLVRLLINDMQVDVQLPLLLAQGQKIPLKITEVNGQKMLEIPPEVAESYTPASASLRQSLPKQESMQKVLPRLFQMLSDGEMPASLQKALTDALTQLPKAETLLQGAGVKNALLNSGIFLEHKLLNLNQAPRQKSHQQNAKTGPDDLPKANTIIQDMKGNLLRLLQQFPQTDAKISSKLAGNAKSGVNMPLPEQNAPKAAEEAAFQKKNAEEGRPPPLGDFLKPFFGANRGEKSGLPLQIPSRGHLQNIGNQAAEKQENSGISSPARQAGQGQQANLTMPPSPKLLTETLAQLANQGDLPSSLPNTTLGKAIKAFIEANNILQSNANTPKPEVSLPAKNTPLPSPHPSAPENLAKQTPPLKAADSVNNLEQGNSTLGNRSVFSPQNMPSQRAEMADAIPRLALLGQSGAENMAAARQLTEAALGRIELTQLASLPRGGAQYIFTEIVANHPFLWVIPLRIRIDPDARGDESEMTPHWSVALTLDLGDLGRMDTLLWQERGAVSASLWTEKAETRILLRERLQQLQVFFQEAGVVVGNLSLHEGSPPVRADEPHIDATHLVSIFL